MVRAIPRGEDNKQSLPWTFKFDRALLVLSLLHAVSFFVVVYLRWVAWGAASLSAWAMTALLLLCVSFARFLDLRSATYLESGAACGVSALTTFLGVTLVVVDYAPRFAMISFVGIPVVCGALGLLAANLERAPRHCYRCGRELSAERRIHCRYCLFGPVPNACQLGFLRSLARASRLAGDAMPADPPLLEATPPIEVMRQLRSSIQRSVASIPADSRLPADVVSLVEQVSIEYPRTLASSDPDQYLLGMLIEAEFVGPLSLDSNCSALRDHFCDALRGTWDAHRSNRALTTGSP